jgi:hypothetical protein
VGGPSPAVVFGDETSVGLAVANGDAHRVVLEVTSASETRSVLDTLGLSGATLVEREADDAHRAALVEATLQALARHPGARLVLSGRAAAIQIVRQGLKARGVALGGARAKAYWTPGKVGLD